MPRNRAKRPEARTLELIQFVDEMRPKKGRHPGNAPWSQVLERWNEENGRLQTYEDEKSIEPRLLAGPEAEEGTGALVDRRRDAVSPCSPTTADAKTGMHEGRRREKGREA